MKIIKTKRLPSGSDMVWTPFATFVRDDDGVRAANAVAADRDTAHWLLDALLSASVAIDFAVMPDMTVIAWFWSIMTVVFLGLAYKAASVAIVAAEVENLDDTAAASVEPKQPAAEVAA